MIILAGAHLHHTRVWMVDEHWDFALAPAWGRVLGPATPVLGVLVRQVFGFSLVRVPPRPVASPRTYVTATVLTCVFADAHALAGRFSRCASLSNQRLGCSLALCSV